MRYLAVFALLVLAMSAAAQHRHAGEPHDARTVPPEAEIQLAELRAAIDRYRDFASAEREGWKRFGGDGPLMGEHWYLPRHRGGVDYVHGDAIDFSRPSNLMYTMIDGRRVLTGVTFNVRLAAGEPVPDGFAGDADRWHVHDFEQAIAAALQDRPVLRWLVNGWIDRRFRDRGDNRSRLAMVHVWSNLPNPDGPFANHNRFLPYMKLGLPTAYAEGASVEAARGLHLATPAGCRESMDGALWIANAGDRARDALRDACTQAAAHVREGLASHDPARINAMAEHGWHIFSTAWRNELSAPQQARIAALTEHGEGHPAGQSHRH